MPDDGLDAEALTNGLGVFSLALGLTELLAPHLITRPLGLGGREDLIRVYGAREIASGLGILSTRGRARAAFVWSRVGGDALDVATVASALDQPRAPSGTIGATLATLAAVGALDLYCAVELSRTEDRPLAAALA